MPTPEYASSEANQEAASSGLDLAKLHLQEVTALSSTGGDSNTQLALVPSNMNLSTMPCTVCAGLEPEVAFFLTQNGRNDIWCYKQNPWDEKKIPVPSWASDKREDLAAWEMCTSSNKIKLAAESGCPICKILSQGLRKYVQIAQDEPTVIIFCPSNVLRLRVGVSEDGEDSEVQPVELEFYTDPNETILGQKLGSKMDRHCPREELYPNKAGTARTIPIDSNSDKCWSQIASWIEECASDHFLCGSQTGFIAMPITSPQTLPKRVVDIGDEEDNSGIRLFESNFSAGVYLALSHAWGNHVPLKTTTKTIKRWKKNIPWEKLSNTFQDAIYITRSLGMRYLWIDTLCIIQDDKRDWEIEAADMAKIYQDALIVISATLSSDGTGGCFSDRQTSTEITAVNSDGTETTVFARVSLPHAAFGQSQSISTRWDKNEELKKAAIKKREKDLAEHPVLQRAWCYQERLLSRRTLHYTKHELVWECVQTTHCECGMLRDFSDENNLVRRRMNTVRFDQSDPRMDRLRSQSSSQPAWWLPDEWGKIIGQYSSKRLGYATDTLSALAGLASRLASGEGQYLGKYLAGLWERDIDTYLGWVPLSKEVVRPRDRAQCDFPSWSWVSIDTPFHWPSWGTKETTVCCFHVVGNNFQTNFEDLPSMGNSRGFSRFLPSTLRRNPKPKSPVITVNMTPNGYSVSMPRISYSKWSGGSLFVKGKVMDVTLTGIDDSRDVHAAFLQRDDIQCSFCVDRRSQCLALVGHSVHLMRLTKVTPPKETDKPVAAQKLPDSLAFVLLQVPEKERTFERIGMLRGMPDEWSRYEGEEFQEFELV